MRVECDYWRGIPEVLRLRDRDPGQVDVVEVSELPAGLKAAISTATKQRRELEQQGLAVQRTWKRFVACRANCVLAFKTRVGLSGISPQYAHERRRARLHRTPIRNGSGCKSRCLSR